MAYPSVVSFVCMHVYYTATQGITTALAIYWNYCKASLLLLELLLISQLERLLSLVWLTASSRIFKIFIISFIESIYSHIKTLTSNGE